MARDMKGSALGEGMDWMSLKSNSVSAQSVSYLLPSEDVNFSCTIFSYNSKPSSFSLILRSDQYLLGIELPVNISITSMIEKYHFSSVEFHSTLTFLFSNNFIE